MTTPTELEAIHFLDEHGLNCSCGSRYSTRWEASEHVTGTVPQSGGGALEHWSDCALHDDPPGSCNCGGYRPTEVPKTEVERHTPAAAVFIAERKIERAILAEREACAKEAEDRAPVVQCMSVEPVVSACFDIASAIRNRPTPASEEVDGWTGKPRDLASRQLEAERIAELEAALEGMVEEFAPPANPWTEDQERAVKAYDHAVNTLARP